MNDTYKTISAACEGYFKDRGSKFLAYAFPVHTADETKILLLQVKKEHHHARHHCYAWRIGIEEPHHRVNDDGEPSSTAGKPILGQILSFDLTNIFIVVVRYFGGTLLGTSGLINAYRSAAADALSNAEIITKTVEHRYMLKFTYNEMNAVMQVIKQENLSVDNTHFDLECRLQFSIRKSEAGKIEKIFSGIPGVHLEKMPEG